MITAVAVNVFTESKAQVEQCLKRIRRNLAPDFAKVFLNGVDRPDVLEVCSQFAFQVESGPNYGSNKYWNLWWIRMLEFFRASGAETCFKFDPDTMVDRTPKTIPSVGYFGDVCTSRKGFRFVQGGVTGLGIATVEALLVSKILETRFCELWMRGLAISPYLMDDQLLSIALRMLGILPTCWCECTSRWKMPILNNLGECAIVHPRYY